MLTYLLAFAMGLGSLALYLSAFFYPEIYRKGDLIWSGVGLFYALVLWVCAERITGGVLLGQMASLSLIGWLGWQTFNARMGTSRELPTMAELQTGVDRVLSPEATAQLKQQFSRVKDWALALIATTRSNASETPPAKAYQPLKREDFGKPTVTIETSAEPKTSAQPESNAVADELPTDSSSPPLPIVDRVKLLTSIFQKSKKNTSTYVRKEFRDATPAIDETANQEAPSQEALNQETPNQETPNQETLNQETPNQETPNQETLGSIADTLEKDNLEQADLSDSEENQPPTSLPIEEVLVEEITVEVVKIEIQQVEQITSDSMVESDEVLQEEIEFEASHDDLERMPQAIPQAVPPHPPSPNLVEAAIADAEAKQVPAAPPEASET